MSVAVRCDNRVLLCFCDMEQLTNHEWLQVDHITFQQFADVWEHLGGVQNEH